MRPRATGNLMMFGGRSSEEIGHSVDVVVDAAREGWPVETL
jgi:hypothetical protein